MKKRGALLLNLGSPDTTNVSAVRRYLKEFLSDPRVLDAPAPIRWFVVNLCILPFRPKKSAEAYRNIWTDEGSPLIVTSNKLRDAVAKEVDMPVGIGMRYGNPSTRSAVQGLLDDGVEEIFIVPLYPHFAMSSYQTAVEEAMRQIDDLAPGLYRAVMPPFYEDTAYIDALVASAKPYLEKGYDKLQFSFHGIPERHLRKSDPTCYHCLRQDDCCQVPSPAHATCYRHQCFRTVEAFVQKAGIPEDKYGVSFQSRLGRDPWLKPYTDYRLEALPGEGVKKLLVMCPAFVSDNLETLEEISMEGKETFLEAGGESFEQIPCLNLREDWIAFLRDKIGGWVHHRELS